MTRTLDIFKFVFMCGLALAMLAPFDVAHSASFEVLYSFQGGSDGAASNAGLFADSQADLYGTTSAGGGTGCGGTGCGTVFKLSSNGKEKVLHAFCSVQNCTDGANPYASLIADQNGNLYGTTVLGGGTGCGGPGCGTVFRISPHGTEKVLYSFCVLTSCADGERPYGSLLVSEDGVLHGTTSFGGANGGGTVFSLRLDGKEKVLYSFCSSGGMCFDGVTPMGNVVADVQGNLYGTTAAGGFSADCFGTLFKLAKDGTETVLIAFDLSTVGCTPGSSLIADRKGNLFGVAPSGGIDCSPHGCGTVFKLAPDGTATALYDFTGGSDGAGPSTGLVADKQGNLYGITGGGGGTGCSNQSCGTVFKLAPDGTETVLYGFAGGSDGDGPVGGLILVNGYLYGTTTQGGTTNSNCSSGCGVVFRVKK
jgi:uncharacterized repeat protein (TIGR03803 family)